MAANPRRVVRQTQLAPNHVLFSPADPRSSPAFAFAAFSAILRPVRARRHPAHRAKRHRQNVAETTHGGFVERDAAVGDFAAAAGSRSDGAGHAPAVHPGGGPAVVRSGLWL